MDNKWIINDDKWIINDMMMIIKDMMMIIYEVTDKNNIMKGTKLTIIRRIIRSKLDDLPILNCHTPMSSIL